MSEDYMDTVKAVGIAMIGIALIAVVAAAVFSPLAAMATAEDGIEFPEGDIEIEGVDDDADVEVLATTGEGLYIDGDGHVDAPAGGQVTDGHWSVTATGWLDYDANQNATYTVTGAESAEVLVQYHQGQWSAIYYDDSGDSAQALVDATDPNELTTLVVTWDDTAEELTLSVDDDRTDTATLTADTPDRSVANDWHGILDEVRYIDRALSGSETSTYHDDPINPLASADHNLRLMFDEGEGDTTRAFYAGDSVDAQLVNADWKPGVDDPGLVEGTDFTISTDPLTVSIVEGGYLDGAPIVYISTGASGFASLMFSVMQTGASALGLLVVGILVFAASAVLREFGGSNF